MACQNDCKSCGARDEPTTKCQCKPGECTCVGCWKSAHHKDVSGVDCSSDVAEVIKCTCSGNGSDCGCLKEGRACTC
ncbi:hypothetical protein E3P92_00455 [Wallemia ichthyophaga]|uniref:Metallothionein n=1 Tax=Wallemia ichthyophaga TaxID=245174 RepID=A0A4V4MAI1_WALIC|nr:hypothetical protein E3P91_01551 [Wallemia ichthyophaga]TIA82198.1 hypothetical protein E3P98_01560 [Wallemia ichthyophaga]TIA94291.1 hypothetical protein E3P97_00196 [Wallemia ichthyophaga]TIB03400.1 hypothetical protein E3P95_00609 [Wallemia ichthyophaga]TIB04174.1 hypothetical protein E3P94_00661 [Wallemia ichthyophaga]